MAVATALKSETKVGEWSTIFPCKQVNETQSALFVKKLLAVAVSNITYLRAIFPESAYGDRRLEDISLKVLRDESSCPGACQVIKWVKGCFDALDKKYLKTIVIGIYVDPKHPETVIESYTFKFSYNEHGPNMNIFRNNKKLTGAATELETKKATIRLLRTIIVLTQSLSSLPEDVMMTMKLFYYDEVTPCEYQPPGFQAGDADTFKFEEEPMNICVGDVSTPFHTVKMRIKTDGKQFEMKEEEENVSQAEVSEDKAEQQVDDEAMDVEGEINGTKPTEVECPIEGDEVPVKSPCVPNKAKDVAFSPGSVTDDVYETADEEYLVKCPCENNEDDGLMIQCESCKYWQHAVCFAVISEDQAPEKHLCNLCVDTNDPESMKLCDSFLIGLSPVLIQSTCLWRRTLLSVSEISRIHAPNLAKKLCVEITVAQGLINRLEKEGYCKTTEKGKRLGKVINKQKVKEEGFKKYFSRGQSVNHDVPEETTSLTNQQDNSQVEQLTQKTEEIAITEKSQTEKLSQTRSQRSKNKKAPCSPTMSSGRRKRAYKVAVSVDNKQNKFEISDSQDVEPMNSGRKRRKASIARKSVAF
ncbi:uncharacterized protein [Antedon mediterranea]|uniref:uncharacterized protein n=1 Tax=Antedon mediterranea TaxID=105859 RepID=UPI003AF8A2CF